eukprot:s9439_g1.t2
MRINVALLSGRTASVHVESEALVQELRREAERALGCRLKAVVSSSGEAISEEQALAAAGIHDGETLYPGTVWPMTWGGPSATAAPAC